MRKLLWLNNTTYLYLHISMNAMLGKFFWWVFISLVGWLKKLKKKTKQHRNSISGWLKISYSCKKKKSHKRLIISKREKTLKNNFIFVISIHTSALMYFRFKPNKTQEKKHISSSFALSLLRKENKGIAEGENLQISLFVLFLWF